VLKAALDDQFDDGDASPYRRQYLTVRRAALVRAGEGVVALAALLDAIEDAIGVDEAAREGGFVQGYEFCRLLLLGERPPDVEVLLSGARSARTPPTTIRGTSMLWGHRRAEAETISET
jgi:hypothetical protein